MLPSVVERDVDLADSHRSSLPNRHSLKRKSPKINATQGSRRNSTLLAPILLTGWPSY